MWGFGSLFLVPVFVVLVSGHRLPLAIEDFKALILSV